MLDFKRQIHAPLAAQHIDQQRDARALGPLKQQRRPPSAGYPVGDFRDLENRVDFRGDALELAFLFQFPDELAQILVRHVAASVPPSLSFYPA